MSTAKVPNPSLCLSSIENDQSSSRLLVEQPQADPPTNAGAGDDDEGSLDRDNKRRRTRTNFTSVQIDELERAFQDGQ